MSKFCDWYDTISRHPLIQRLAIRLVKLALSEFVNRIGEAKEDVSLVQI